MITVYLRVQNTAMDKADNFHRTPQYKLDWVFAKTGTYYQWRDFVQTFVFMDTVCPDSKVHGAIMGPAWVLSAPDGPHVGPMNLAIRVVTTDTYGCDRPPQHAQLMQAFRQNL